MQLQQKLKSLRGEWNKTLFGNVLEQVKCCQEKVSSLEATLQQQWSQPVYDQFSAAKAELSTLVKQEDTFLREKSRIKWLKEQENGCAKLRVSYVLSVFLLGLPHDMQQQLLKAYGGINLGPKQSRIKTKKILQVSCLHHLVTIVFLGSLILEQLTTWLVLTMN